MLKFSESLNVGYLHRNERLNPKLWDGDVLRPEVRTSLLNFAEAWRRFARIPPSAVQDILMVGGNAGYFYNDSSDIDVHLLIDRTSLGFGNLTDDFLKDRKSMWTQAHDVRVKGYSVEPYAQDVRESSPEGQGVYSILRRQWVKRPTESRYDPSVDAELDRKVADWQRAIDHLVDQDAGVEAAEQLKKRLSEMRGNGIKAGGELAQDNLVFKSLRLSNHLDKLSKYKRDKETRELSLD